MKFSIGLSVSLMLSSRNQCYGEDLRGSINKYQMTNEEGVAIESDAVDGFEVRAVHNDDVIDGVALPNTDFYVKNQNSRGEIMNAYARCYSATGGFKDILKAVKFNEEVFVCNSDYNYIFVYGESNSCIWSDPSCQNMINEKCYFKDYFKQKGCEKTCTYQYKVEGCP